MADRLLAGSGSDAYTPEDWVTGNKQIITDSVTVAGSQGTLAAKSVLGEVTASGKALLSAAAAGDGSETAKWILVHEVDTSGGDVVAPVYLEGCFNPSLLAFGAGHDADSVKADLESRNLYLKAPA